MRRRSSRPLACPPHGLEGVNIGLKNDLKYYVQIRDGLADEKILSPIYRFKQAPALLEEKRDAKVIALSGGMKRRLNIGLGLLHRKNLVRAAQAPVEVAHRPDRHAQPVAFDVDARENVAGERGEHQPAHDPGGDRGALGAHLRRAEVAEEFKYFPGEALYEAFRALGDVDSITVDPHKLGYVPYTAGAFVARNREVVDFVSQQAAYVFDLGDVEEEEPRREKLHHLGQYILEGSKSGASAAAVHVTHRVLPLHSEGFGRLLKETVKSCEYFWDTARDMSDRLADWLGPTKIPIRTPAAQNQVLFGAATAIAVAAMSPTSVISRVVFPPSLSSTKPNCRTCTTT